MSEPFSTMIWVNRIEALKSHLRIIATECDGLENARIQWVVRQALAGVAEADRYLAEPEWPAEEEVMA